MRKMMLLALVAGLMTAACATQAPQYQARAAGERYGYAEQQVEPNRVRISYNGNTLTPRETVETYLLYRAAETTLARGYDSFLIVAHDVQDNTSYEGVGAVRPGIGGVRRITSHNALADIVMFEGHPPGNANLYDAHAVQQSLEMRIVRGNAP
ncbi:CC0125/CC1285 family lipoprotein [Terricaulis sp.]|uniref:CC0125/CC1285 family lipoprotein n=1 Tax=Terricaulis sp. TaxID=2768686 RepID=UPI003784971B